MRLFPHVVLALMLLPLSCISPRLEFPSTDCTGAVPAQFTRIYIGAPSHRGTQSGTSADDPLDGTTADKFDTILRTIAEGHRPAWGTQSQIAPDNLIVCIGPGVFETNGQYDWRAYLGHTQGALNSGFTVERNWKIHGHGKDQTLLRLASVVTGLFVGNDGSEVLGGQNTAIGTHSVDASGVEVSDLTIDANHDTLNRSTGLPLDLSAIALRSVQGGHWIHDVNVIGASGDLGDLSAPLENFPVLIWGETQPGNTSQSLNNVIENVNLTDPGKPVENDRYPGGALSGIVVANAAGEIRNNLVEGYEIGYGGWSMGPTAWFHDNTAKNTRYGFNADSFDNIGVILESNKIIHPAAYGIVIGGSSPLQQFAGWRVLNNTITLDSPNAVGIVLRGQVRGAFFSGNTVLVDAPGVTRAAAIWSYPSAPGVMNNENVYSDNQFDSSLQMNFSADPNFNSDCRFGNRDLEGRPLPEFPDNSHGLGACVSARATAPLMR